MDDRLVSSCERSKGGSYHSRRDLLGESERTEVQRLKIFASSKTMFRRSRRPEGEILIQWVRRTRQLATSEGSPMKLLL